MDLNININDNAVNNICEHQSSSELSLKTVENGLFNASPQFGAVNVHKKRHRVNTDSFDAATVSTFGTASNYSSDGGGATGYEEDDEYLDEFNEINIMNEQQQDIDYGNIRAPRSSLSVLLGQKSSIKRTELVIITKLEDGDEDEDEINDILEPIEYDDHNLNNLNIPNQSNEPR
eukprot:183242_1